MELDTALRLPQVLACTGYSRPTLYRRMDEGRFPRGRKDGRITWWSAREVAEWQANRSAS
jgi:prophage regulatory protein